MKRIDAYLDSILTQAGSLDETPGTLRLNEYEVYGLLDLLGIDRCPAAFLPVGADVSRREDWAREVLDFAAAQGRFLLKITGRDILHKTEIGGVRILKLADLAGADDLLARVDDMIRSIQAEGLDGVVEGVVAGAFVPHAANTPGQELLLSLRQDPAFGPCVVLGIGGTLTEWYGRAASSTLIFPAEGLTAETVRTAVEGHPLVSILCVPSRLYREAPMSLDQLTDAVMALAEVGTHCGPDGPSALTLEEIEINPAVASEGRLVALDGVGLVSARKWARVQRPLGKVNNLLAPRSAVVLGVSAKGANPGRIILNNLLESAGIARDRLYVVHARETEIGGVSCFKSIADLPEKCDLAVISVPAQGALETIGELVRQDMAESMILIPGGFAEAGEAGLASDIESVLTQGHSAKGGGPVMVGGNCLGIVSRDNYNTFFLPDYKLPFNPGLGRNLAIVSQSGAYLVTFASNYDGVIHPRASISFGNQMDLTVSDFLEHFAEVPDVDVVACYVEGFREGDGARFLTQARRLKAQGKQVIAFKAGKTALGAQAAASHTASLAGDYAVARSCLEAAGVTVAESLDEFEDLLKTFTLLADRRHQGNRVGIISNAGFECSTVMDQLDGLDLAEFDDAAQAELDAVLPGFAHRTNPIDCTPMTGTEAFAASCRAILGSKGVDLAILSSVPVTPALDNLPASVDGAHREDLTGDTSQVSLMIREIKGSTKPAVVVVDSGTLYDPMCRLIEAAGIPVFRKIDRAARSLAAYCRAQGE